MNEFLGYYQRKLFFILFGVIIPLTMSNVQATVCPYPLVANSFNQCVMPKTTLPERPRKLMANPTLCPYADFPEYAVMQFWDANTKQLVSTAGCYNNVGHKICYSGSIYIDGDLCEPVTTNKDFCVKNYDSNGDVGVIAFCLNEPNEEKLGVPSLVGTAECTQKWNLFGYKVLTDSLDGILAFFNLNHNCGTWATTTTLPPKPTLAKTTTTAPKKTIRK